MSIKRFLLVAVDHGASMALRPLAKYEDFIFQDANEISVADAYWQAIFNNYPWSALIIGTSDSKDGKRIETAAHHAAIHHGISTVAIEDYPGNYKMTDNKLVDVLVVDSEFSSELYKKQHGERCPEIWVCKSIRYDTFRNAARKCTAPNKNSSSENKGSGVNVLWAGQPETDDGVKTLERIVPSLVRQNVTLLFKAHPRDAGYHGQVYQKKFKEWKMKYVDVTDFSFNECMELEPKLILTQFSSLAIEAGYFGIPAINVLYDDIGAKRLYTKKGYRIPPWCLANAAFLITSIERQDDILRKALTDDKERTDTLDKFHLYFDVLTKHAPYLVRKIRQCFNNENIRSI